MFAVVSGSFVRKSGDNMSGNLTFDAGKTVVGQGKIKTGTYTGNGADNRTINLGVDLASKSNVFVSVKAVAANTGMHRIEHSQGDLSMRWENAGDFGDVIQSFAATGFVVGTHNTANGNTIVYRYIARWED